MAVFIQAACKISVFIYTYRLLTLFTYKEINDETEHL
ncbi:hypothetical protein ABIA51_003899 [Erwinia aphidicola]